MKKCKCYKGWIYLYINKINGKRYVGQTVNFRKRCNEHARGKDSNSLLDRAIKKYGIENFKIIVLEVFVCNSLKKRKQRLNDKEIFWIEKLESYVKTHPDKGYNIIKGGKGNSGFKRENAKVHIADYETEAEWNRARRIAEKRRRDMYYALNRDEILRKSKVYTDAHKEEKRIYDKEYHKNKIYTPKQLEQRKAAAKKYREKHREECLAKLKEWRKNNKEKMAAQNKLYRQTHWKDEEGHWHKIEVQ